MLPKFITSTRKLTKNSEEIKKQLNKTDTDVTCKLLPNNLVLDAHCKTDENADNITELLNNQKSLSKNYFVSFDKNLCDSSDSNLSHIIREKIEIETRNIEELFDKTVNGIVELKDDLMRMNENQELFVNDDELRSRNGGNTSSVDTFFKKEIDAINAAVQQGNVVPAILSNGHYAK